MGDFKCMEPNYAAGLVWLRRDLRAGDNAALYRALKACRQVHCVFAVSYTHLTLPTTERV